MEWEEKKKSGHPRVVCGKQVMHVRRGDKTKAKSLVLPETKKVAMLVG